jgi:hypothetical protein
VARGARQTDRGVSSGGDGILQVSIDRMRKPKPREGSPAEKAEADAKKAEAEAEKVEVEAKRRKLKPRRRSRRREGGSRPGCGSRRQERREAEARRVEVEIKKANVEAEKAASDRSAVAPRYPPNDKLQNWPLTWQQENESRLRTRSKTKACLCCQVLEEPRETKASNQYPRSTVPSNARAQRAHTRCKRCESAAITKTGKLADLKGFR